MHVSIIALVLFLLPAQNEASTPIDARSTEKVDLLQALPEDISVAVFVDLRGENLVDGVLTSIAGVFAHGDEQAALLADLIQSIPGSIVVGHAPDPRPDKEDGLVIVMDISKPGFEFRDWLEKRLLPVMRTLTPRKRYGSLRIEGDGGAMRIINPGKDEETVAYIAVRGRTAYLASRPDLARAAAKSVESRKSLADAPGMRKILRELPNDAVVRAIFNPRPLIEALKSPKPKSPEALFREVLSPDDLIAAGGFVQLRGRSIEAGAVALLADECKGVARWLDRANTESALLSELAGEFPVLFRVGIPSLTALPDAIYDITDNFDKTISTEYREDLAAFNKQTGIDFNAAILGQIRDEFVIALRPDMSKQPPVAWAVVAPVSSAPTLESACTKLAQHFELEFESRTTDGFTIHTSPRPNPISWCVAGNRLILGDALATVRDVARRGRTGASQSSRHVVERGTRELGASNQMMLLTDVGLLCRQAPMLPVLAGQRFAPLLGDGYIGASLTNRDRFVRLLLRWELGGKPVINDESSAGDVDQILLTVGETMAQALTRARYEAQRTIAMSHQRGIAMALTVYANTHDGAYPESLEQLVREKPEFISLNMLQNPYTNECPTTIDEIGELSHVVYRTGLTNKSDPQEVILAERRVHDGPGGAGASFAFVDGHCEYLDGPLASRILEMIDAGEPTITVEAARASLESADAP